MIYTRDYDTSYFPAMPVVEIVIRYAANAPEVSLIAVVDSGADATIIPRHYLRQVRARKGEKAWLRGTAASRMVVDRYWVSLGIGGHIWTPIQVVGAATDEEAILGRDVLNHLIVTLNGLASVVEISD
jgi:hypothetical protein